jgi:quercetin dioxygenase-like cupin family protein
MLKFRPMKPRHLLLAAFLSAVVLRPQSAPPEVAITNEPHHHLAFENDYVRVFKVEVLPQAATLLHRHHHDYVFVTLGASEVSNEVVGKPPVRLHLRDGDTRFVPGNFAHIARDLAPTPFRNLTIEFLQDDTLRNRLPPKWGEERALKVFNGGTQDILFVNDGVRVSEIELQAGGVVPSHHHQGPHLLVALTDLEVRSDVEGMGPMLGHFKSGEVKWLPGGYTHTLTNLGKQTAKFVTLEFP